MNNIIATWICIDDEVSGTYFPSAKGNSSDSAVQQIYWRCICTFYWSARYHNPKARLVLFSNQSFLPDLEGTSIKDVLKTLGVQFFVTPFEYIPPEGYYSTWRNQFYEFSVFKFISNHESFKTEDHFLLLDSDCIITGDLTPLFNSLDQQECITYLMKYKPDYTINGNSRKDMKDIFEELLGHPISDFPEYHGGEFYASNIKTVRLLMNDFYVVWEQLMIRHAKGQKKLHEEAHVLSYLFYKNNIQGGVANQFIKRLWTDPTSFRNIRTNDEKLLVWHLPAEKRTGFRKFFNWLQSKKFQLDHNIISVPVFHKRIQKTFLVPGIPFIQKSFFAVKSIAKRIMSFY